MATLPLPPSTRQVSAPGQMNVRPGLAVDTLNNQAQLSRQAVEANQGRQTELAQRDVQNAGAVGGEGFLGSLSAALSDSPQLQSGVLAAGLSLLFGNDAQSSVSAGLNAASGYNALDETDTQQKKAEAAGMLKQQSQLENSYSEANYRDRLPDDQGVEIARLNAGVARNTQTNDFLKTKSQLLQFAMSPPESGGLGMGQAVADNWVNNIIGTTGKDFKLNYGPGVGKPEGTPGPTNNRPNNAANAEIRAAKAAYDASTLPKAEKDRIFLNGITKIPGLERQFPNAASALQYADSIAIKPAGTKAEPAAPAKPDAKPAPKAPPKIELPGRAKVVPGGGSVDFSIGDSSRGGANSIPLYPPR